MPLSFGMVASEILMCGLKKVPVAGDAIEIIEAIRSRHERMALADQVAQQEERLSRFEQRQRDLIVQEVRTILGNLGQSELAGEMIEEEISNLRQIQEQGWNPSLFEGLFINSSLRDQLKKFPNHFGRVLDDHERIVHDRGIQILIDLDKTHILEIPARSLSLLLANQMKGIPLAKIEAAQDIWAFANFEVASSIQQPATVESLKRVVTETEPSFQERCSCSVADDPRWTVFSVLNDCFLTCNKDGLLCETIDRVVFSHSRRDLRFASFEEEYGYGTENGSPYTDCGIRVTIGQNRYSVWFHALNKDKLEILRCENLKDELIIALNRFGYSVYRSNK